MELTCKCLWDNDLQSFYGSHAGGESGWRHWPPEYRKQANLRQQSGSLAFHVKQCCCGFVGGGPP
jgi:hypothetical protein